jgi:hypothetical protein
MVGVAIEPGHVQFFKKLQNEAEAAGDIFLLGRVARPLTSDANCQSFAKIMSNPYYISASAHQAGGL